MKRHGHNPPALLSQMFGLDLRSLAAFRIGVALFVLFDLVSRSFDLTAHYTNAGTIPGDFLVRSFWHPAYFSVHLLADTTAGVTVIFVLHAIAAIALLLGYHTRIATFIVWFLMASLQTRHPLILHAGDDLLRIVLFIGIFLPLGARYSIDARRKPRPKRAEGSELYVSPATAIYYFQYIFVFFFSALLKSGPEWTREGTAIYYALNIDQFVLPLGKALLDFPGLMKALTFAVWWIELLGGFILLIPHPIAKLCGLLLFASLELGFAATLSLGHFPWVNAVALLPLLPGLVWDRRRKAEYTSDPAIRISWWREALLAFLFLGVFLYNIAPLTSNGRPVYRLEFPTVLARLDQAWSMFAPAPSREDGWYVVEGRLSSGEKVEAFREQREINYAKPGKASDFYPNERWRKYMMLLWARDYADFRLPFAEYVCRNWNGKYSGPDHLEAISVYFMLEMTPPPSQAPAPVQKLNLIDYRCRP